MTTAPAEAKAQPAALFISDLHLQASMPRTAQAFFHFMRHPARTAQQLYLLGDIFEYWAGDDDPVPFNRQVIAAIREVSDAGVEIFWIAGNRDFLAGPVFAEACGLRLLSDPHVATIAGHSVVLTHGDAQCTDDDAYMAFRAQVRRADWQQAFLARPIAERKAIIADLRKRSRDAQSNKADDIADVNADAIANLFDASAANIMIHGHTHRPARHITHHNGNTRLRYVLPDWDHDTAPVRGGWIAIGRDGQITRFGADGLALPQTA